MADPKSKQTKNIDDFIARIRSRQEKKYDIEDLFDNLVQGDKAALSKAITLVESRKSEDLAYAHMLLEKCLPAKPGSKRIGITGTPGVGKSTFINTYAQMLMDKGHKVAILSVDPSSYISKGSILGDKTRMDAISGKDSIYIRPSATGETLGGVHERTRESILLCEAAGYDHIIVETVGVGQSEHVVQRMTDILVLLLLPGSGDELQGIKKGIMEVADVILINKADVFQADTIQRTITEYQHALHLTAKPDNEWTVQIRSSDATSVTSVMEIAQLVEQFFEHSLLKDSLIARREHQWHTWFNESLGWAVKEVIQLKGLKMMDYYPSTGELPPAKAIDLIRANFK